jgi:hypothetical protein
VNTGPSFQVTKIPSTPLAKKLLLLDTQLAEYCHHRIRRDKERRFRRRAQCNCFSVRDPSAIWDQILAIPCPNIFQVELGWEIHQMKKLDQLPSTLDALLLRALSGENGYSELIS